MPTTSVNGMEMYYELKGSGEPILFIHPPVLPAETFRPQLDRLFGRYRVLAADLRGHGQSSPSPSSWDFSDIADDLNELLNMLGLHRVWVCGYSAGASIAFEFALTYPDRVKGLIQIGSVPEVRGRFLRGVVRLASSLADNGAVSLLAWLGAWTNTKGFRRFIALYRASRRSNGADAASFYRSYLTYTCMDRVHHVDQPVLLVYGEKDKIFGAYAGELVSLLPNSRLACIPRAKHEIPSVHGDELNALIGAFIR
jgi:pimeloyl-ACP methyl ester carboxylesterase